MPLARRQQIMFETLDGKQDTNRFTALAILVKKLQESLTRMESYEVVTVSQGLDGMFTSYLDSIVFPHLILNIDAKRSSPSLLARQLRLRLVASDEADIPKSLSNIVVSIHAIATFQALHDYLRPRVSGLLSGGSRLSSMLAALAASGMTPPPPMPSSSRGPPGDSASSSKPSALSPTTSKADSASSVSQAIARRRSQRLSAKKGANVSAPDAPETNSDVPSADAPIPSNGQEMSASPVASISEPPAAKGPLGSEMAGSETVVPEDDEELAADFTDDEVDAEVRTNHNISKPGSD